MALFFRRGTADTTGGATEGVTGATGGVTDSMGGVTDAMGGATADAVAAMLMCTEATLETELIGM